jgi:replication factor A1
MEIKDLQPKQGSVEVVGEVIEKGDIREFEKFGKSGRVCNAKIKDASGEIKLSLWNEQIDQVNVGDTVKITNGYVNEWQGELQLTTGKFGNLEIVGKAEAAEAKPEEMQTDQGSHILTEDEKTEEESLEKEGFEEPSLEESETEDEKTEEIKIEEEEIQ